MKPHQRALHKTRKLLNPPYTLKDWAIIVVSLFLFVAIPFSIYFSVKVEEQTRQPKAAGAAILYLFPASKSVTVSTNLVVDVRVNTGGEPIVAAEADLLFDASKLEYVSTAQNKTLFPNSPTPIVSSGSVKIPVGVGVGSTVSGDQKIATVTFKAKTTTGSTSITFASSSDVIKPLGGNLEHILGSTTGGTYTIVSATTPPTTPPPTTPPSTPPTSSPPPSTTTTKPPSTSVGTVTDTSDPVISGVSVTDISSDSATIVWQTNEAATSVVEYGKTASYGLIQDADKLVTSHKIELPTSLSAGSTYYFRVKSMDKAGNSATSQGGTFKTKGYLVQVTVLDKAGVVLADAKASLSPDGQTVRTDSSGLALFTDVAASSQELTIEYAGRKQTKTITIKPSGVKGKSLLPQKFTVQVQGISAQDKYIRWIGLGLIVFGVFGLILTLSYMWTSRRHHLQPAAAGLH